MGGNKKPSQAKERFNAFEHAGGQWLGGTLSRRRRPGRLQGQSQELRTAGVFGDSRCLVLRVKNGLLDLQFGDVLPERGKAVPLVDDHRK